MILFLSEEALFTCLPCTIRSLKGRVGFKGYFDFWSVTQSLESTQQCKPRPARLPVFSNLPQFAVLVLILIRSFYIFGVGPMRLCAALLSVDLVFFYEKMMLRSSWSQRFCDVILSFLWSLTSNHGAISFYSKAVSFKIIIIRVITALWSLSTVRPS